jgi:putative protease
MQRPELLAPAGSQEALLAALANGADAIYLGGKQFSARQSAANFSLPELAAAVQLAHRAKAKVYVTVNTLLKDAELEAAVKFLRQLYNIGVDAVIVQDPGLIALAQATTPQLELHASTQLTIHNAAGVNALVRRGVKRVVLARELSFAEIKQIAATSKASLEVFVHGALCVAYSGQCLLSSIIGGRSGNRGQCAQPCRLPYSWLGTANQPAHLLSPHDLCLLPYLSQLLELPVAAWKIEGRLKRPAYVGTVVRHYREAIDRLTENAGLDDIDQRLFELAQVFNRGFTSGYTLSRPGPDLLSVAKPGHQGVNIGVMLPSGDISFTQAVRRKDVLAGEGGQEYEIQDLLQGNRKLEQLAAGQVAHLPGYRLAPGSSVMRLVQSSIEQAVAEQVATYEPPAWPIDFEVKLQRNHPLQLQAIAGGHSTQIEGTRLPELAKHVAVDRALLERQLSKLGGSGFALANLMSDIEPGLALPVSEINYCRRQAVASLSQILWGQHNPLPETVSLPAALRPAGQAQGQSSRLAVIVASLEQLEVALQHADKLSRIYFGASYHSYADPKQLLAVYKTAQTLASQRGLTCYLRLPRILLPKELAAWQEALATANVSGLLLPNWGCVELAHCLGLPYVLDTSMNAYNTWFSASLPDADGYLLSTELNRTETKQMLAAEGPRAHLLIHARHLLMVHEQCLLGANGQCRGRDRCQPEPQYLLDRKGYRFPLLGDATCRSYLYNSQVFSLIDQLHALKQGPRPAELVIDAELEQPETLEQILPLYLAAWYQEQPGHNCKQELEAIYGSKLTRGHWNRGV